MKRIYLLLSAAWLIGLFSCTQGGDKSQTTASVTEAKVEMVNVMELAFKEISHSVEFTSTLLGFEEVHLAPASPGRIDAIYVETGSRVSKGTVLVQMDRTQLHQAEIQMKNIATNFDRLDTLRKVGSIAEQQYDQLKTQYDIAKSNVDFLSENTRLKAPFSGVISGKYFEAGEMYSGAPVATVGKAAILSIVQISRLKTIVSVSEKYYPQIRNGMTVNMKCDIYPDKGFTGKVFRIHPTMDQTSRTFNVEVMVENPGEILRPGMFTRVTFELEKVEAIVLPALAVLKMQGSNERYLFIAKDGKAKRLSVTIGNRYDDQVEVVSDELKPGDQVIVSGQARILDGATVKIAGK
jgi:membrane fusion protein, multidrug efflux system